MRLYEIETTNSVWLRVQEIKFDITEEYNSIINLLEFLIQQHSPYRNKTWLPTIEEFEEELLSRSNLEFPDSSDEDVIKFKHIANNMKNKISNLKSKLV
jgi:hypothetical protein